MFTAQVRGYLGRRTSRSRSRRGERGFTLIELLIVAFILSVLAAILIPNFLRARTNSQVSASKSNLKELATALETYYVDNQAYPNDVTLNILATGAYIRALPLDPCTLQAYVYTPSGGPPPSTYTLQTPTWVGKLCAITANGLIYTPSGGLVQQ